jgi:tetrapyrrole methylase family protein/MazG family protein
MAEEEGLFTFEDVAGTVADKMVRRHPHVFSGVTFASEEERKASWEKIKQEEKKGKEDSNRYLPEAFEEARTLIDKAEERKGYKK